MFLRNLRQGLATSLGFSLLVTGSMIGHSNSAAAADFSFGNSIDKGCVNGPNNNKSCSLSSLVKFLNAQEPGVLGTLPANIDVFLKTPSGNTFGPASTLKGIAKFSVGSWAPNNQFGIYSIEDSSKTLTLKSGTPNSKTLLPIGPNTTLDSALGAPFNQSSFGFFLKSQDGIFRSHEIGFGAVDKKAVRFLSYKLTNSPFDYLIAFEDQNKKADRDYNDFVALVKFTKADVPEPAAIAGLGLVGSLLVVARRRKTIATE